RVHCVRAHGRSPDRHRRVRGEQRLWRYLGRTHRQPHDRAVPHRHDHPARPGATDGGSGPHCPRGHLCEEAQEAPRPMSTRENVAANFDRPILLMYLLLMFMGWLNIYSASYDADHPYILDTSREYGKQAVWMGISL